MSAASAHFGVNPSTLACSAAPSLNPWFAPIPSTAAILGGLCSRATFGTPLRPFRRRRPALTAPATPASFPFPLSAPTPVSPLPPSVAALLSRTPALRGPELLPVPSPPSPAAP